MAKKVVQGKSKTLVCSKPQRGFTLIEMLVVLVLLSLMTGMAVPSLWNSYLRRSEQMQVEAIVHQVAALRRQARQQGEPLLLNAADFRHQGKVALPDDWQVQKMQQLRFLTNGVTNGGEVLLQAPSGWKWTIRYRPLDGKVKVLQ